jgi:hypothetical protein
MHFTPTSGSWLNLVEIFFDIITQQAIQRGSFDSVKELVAAITRFIHAWNERCEPFTWTKTTVEILDKAIPKDRQPLQARDARLRVTSSTSVRELRTLYSLRLPFSWGPRLGPIS